MFISVPIPSLLFQDYVALRRRIREAAGSLSVRFPEMSFGTEWRRMRARFIFAAIK